MSDISSQLIKDSYNYVLQSDVSTGNIYRIGGGIPVNPIFLSGLTINGELNATTISSGPVIIKSNNNDQLLLTTTNYNSGSDGNILYFYTQTGITYSNISARTNGGSSNADLVLQESIGSNVGIGKVPSSIYKLDVNGAIGATSISATTIQTVDLVSTLPTQQIVLKTSSGTVSARIFNDSNILRIKSSGSHDTLNIFSTGNLGVNQTTDAGFKLDVNGTARVQGKLTMTGNIEGSNGITIGSVSNPSAISFFSNLISYNSSYLARTGTVHQFSAGFNNNLTTGENSFTIFQNGFAPISGTGIWNLMQFTPTINQTGGASGTTRGLYVNPTLTSAADFRAIETTNGKVIFGGTGNVLIGTTTDAGYKLDVSGTVRVTGDTTALTFNASNNGGSYKVQGTNVLDYGNGIRIGYFNGVQKITLYTNAGTPQLTVLNTGNVLIGTTTDAGYKLDVNGNTRITGNLTVSGNTNITGGLTATTISATTYQGIPKTFGAVFDNGGSVILSGTQVDVIFNNTVILNSWTMIADTTGSTVVDIWKDTYANYPPTSSDTIITGGTKPNISSDIKNQSSSLSGWNTIINSGDIVRFNVDTCSSITKLTLSIYATQI